VTCGCGKTDQVSVSLHTDAPHPYVAGHVHDGGNPYRPQHGHRHHHAHGAHEGGATLAVDGKDSHTVALEQKLLGKNQLIAERNRGWLAERGVLALNLVSSPGAGKTTLLERMLTDLKGRLPMSVIEGDQETSNDAERIRATGVPAVQVNTGTGCHLEADMLERALALLQPLPDSLLLIENVGNLVCPALFDLGESAKVVIFSITEGEDKPLKYPHMFRAAEVLIVSKMDLAPHLRFDLGRALENARKVNPALNIFQVSAYTGEGLDQWYGWIRNRLGSKAERDL
jgi:hydrogenase nickel incorporation protein HypB